MEFEPEARTYTSQRLRLRYWVWGDESRPPLILIHGTRDHARSWDRVAAHFADRYAVYAPDLRGHGDSDWAIGGQYSIIDYVLDIHALGEAIGRPPYTIVGHSLGGAVSLLYACTFPELVSKLVTIEGLGAMWRRERTPAHERMRRWVADMRDLERRRPRVYPTIEAAVERMRQANPHLTPDLARHLTIHGVRKVEGGYTWKFDNFTRAHSPYEFNMEDARDIWNQIRCPILIIWGAESWSRRMGEVDLSPFHDCRSVVVPDAGHWVHHDQFEAVVREIEAFIGSEAGKE